MKTTTRGMGQDMSLCKKALQMLIWKMKTSGSYSSGADLLSRAVARMLWLHYCYRISLSSAPLGAAAEVLLGLEELQVCLLRGLFLITGLQLRLWSWLSAKKADG